MKTDITVVLDRSGSMGIVRASTIKGFNDFLDGQKAVPGEAAISLVQFDDQYEPNYLGSPLANAAHLNEESYSPRGSTALVDACCKTIDDTGARLASMLPTARPDKVIFVIITDGQENCSKNFKLADLNARIKLQKETYKWEFVFIGANQDAIATAASMGIGRSHAMNYTANHAGTAAVYASVGQNLKCVRTCQVDSMSFSDGDRKAQDSAKGI